LRVPPRGPEEAGPRRRDERGPASARGARRAHERRRCLVQLSRLDRHRSSPLKRNTTPHSQMINRKLSATSNNLTRKPEPRPSIYTGFRTPSIMRGGDRAIVEAFEQAVAAIPTVRQAQRLFVHPAYFRR